MKRIVIIVLVALMLLLGACINDGERDLGVNEMGEQLLTKNEFLQLLSEHEEILEVSVADFDDVDVEDFIIVQGFSEKRFLAFVEYMPGNFKTYLKNYISGLKIRNIDDYRPTEIIIADSTEEEFEDFLNRYIEALGGDLVSLTYSRPTQYVIDRDGERVEFDLYRTADIESLIARGWEFPSPGYFNAPYGDGRIGIWYFLSKSGKFFIVYQRGISDEVVKIFCELND